MSQYPEPAINDRIPGSRTKYFAYGSNMDTQRLRSHAPSATVVGPAKLLDKSIVFNKRSTDGSGKANLVDSPGDVVWGVLFELDSTELDRLDRAERGYERTTLTVWSAGGNSVMAQVYTSAQFTANPVPYDWYKNLVLAGAREHELPRQYLDYLQHLPSKPDQRSGELP